jgi:hypothetical protein
MTRSVDGCLNSENCKRAALAGGHRRVRVFRKWPRTTERTFAAMYLGSNRAGGRGPKAAVPGSYRSSDLRLNPMAINSRCYYHQAGDRVDERNCSMGRLAHTAITLPALAGLLLCLTGSVALAHGAAGRGAAGHAHGHGHARFHAHAAHSRFSARPTTRAAAGASKAISSAFNSHSDGRTLGPAHELRPGWHKGRWHHERHHGRYGWWWAVGGVWFYYPEEIEGPPPYVSELALPQEVLDAELEARATVFVERDRAIYYAPGDPTGVWYRTGTECAEAQRRAGGAGICLLK